MRLGKYFARHFPQFLVMAVAPSFLAIQSHFLVVEKIYYAFNNIVPGTRKDLQIVLCTHRLINKGTQQNMDYFDFIETIIFSRQRTTLLDDDSFRELQTFLIKYHADGDTIGKTGGCQKIRWNRPGMGKQGGVRIIYYVVEPDNRIFLLTVYAKNAKDDLTEAEKSTFKKLTAKLIIQKRVPLSLTTKALIWIKNFLMIW